MSVFLLFFLLLLSWQLEDIIHNVHNFFKEFVALKPDEKMETFFMKTEQTAAHAYGYSIRTTVRICAELVQTEIKHGHI